MTKIISILQQDLKTNITPLKVSRFGSSALPTKPIRIILNREQDKFTIFAQLKIGITFAIPLLNQKQ